MAPGAGSVFSGFPMSVYGPSTLSATAAPTAKVPVALARALKYTTNLPPTGWISGAQKLSLAHAGRVAAVNTGPSNFQCTRSLDERIG